MRLSGPDVIDKQWTSKELRNYWDARATAFEVDFEKTDVRAQLLEGICMIQNLLPPGSKILDMGCGTGRVAFSLQRRGYNVTGFDFALEMIKYANQIKDRTQIDNPEHIFFGVGDFRCLPFKDGAFDAVVSSTALHHILDVEKSEAIHEFRRVLSPGGVVVLADIMFFFNTNGKDMDDIRTMIQRTFFPNESIERVKERFREEPEEWPTEASVLEDFFRVAGFRVETQKIRDVVGIIYGYLNSSKTL